MKNSSQFINSIVFFISYFAGLLYIYWSVEIVKEDFDTGKIYNKRIIQGLKYVIFIITLQGIISFFGYLGYIPFHLSKEFYMLYIEHLSLSITFSIVLWFGDIWPAGDSKFFIVSLMFLPLVNPRLKGYPGYVWISTMANIFIIAGIFSIARYIKENVALLNKGDSDAFKEVKNYYRDELKDFLKNKWKALYQILSVFSVFLFKQVLRFFLQRFIFNIFKRTDIFFFIMFFLWPKVSEFFNTKIWKFFMFIGYGFVVFVIISLPDPLGFAKPIVLQAIKHTFSFGMILLIGRTVFEKIIELYYVYAVGVDDVKEGMVLYSPDLEIFRRDEKYKKVFDVMTKDGLTSEQVLAIKEWMTNHPKGKEVKLRFVKAYPFSLYILIGCLIEVVLNINIAKIIK